MGLPPLEILLAVLGVIAFTSLGLAWMLREKTITRRVNAMARAARELAAGNLSARTGVPISGDELGVLADHFDEMAASLQRQADEAHASTGALRNLTHRLQSVREDEQTRIAREIHDQLGQVLTALKLDVANVQRQLGGTRPDVTSRLVEMSATLDVAAQTVRRIAGELRPPLLEDLGLGAALEWQAQEFAARAGVHVDVDVAADLGVVPFSMGIGLFRIAQEALTNVARHARATCVAIRLRRRDGHLELDIVDDGAGFVVSERQLTLGMLGMRERAALMGGTLEVASTPGDGARVLARVPVEGRVPS